jgi:hypothetical protein
MKFEITSCVKCDTELDPPGPEGGRPSRFCCEGCKTSTEAEMRRINVLLRKLEEGVAVSLINGFPVQARADVVADLQARYDRLAGARAAPSNG